MWLLESGRYWSAAMCMGVKNYYRTNKLLFFVSVVVILFDVGLIDCYIIMALAVIDILLNIVWFMQPYNELFIDFRTWLVHVVLYIMRHRI